MRGQFAGAEATSTAQDYLDRAAERAGDNPILTDLVAALSSGFTVPHPPRPSR
jgi:metallo-beta-lactamase class B